METDEQVVQAERREATLEAEVARLKREAERLQQAYVAAQEVFEQRRDALMEAKRTARVLEHGEEP
jgi:predicted  nucleic acid-binding Zn-ribbon protein